MEAVAGAVLSLVVSKLGNLLIEELSNVGDIRSDVEELKRELEMMEAFLEDAASKQYSDRLIQTWIMDVRNLAFKAEDVIETFVLDHHRSWIGRQIVARWKVKGKIRGIRAEIEEMHKRRTWYGIERLTGAPSTVRTEVQEQRNISLSADDDVDVVGFDHHVEAVKGMLLDAESRRSFVSIIGMGGIGKTTLAKKVYKTVLPHFECHAWVVVSQTYSLPELLRDIAKCVLRDEKFKSIMNELPQSDELARMRDEKIREEVCTILREKKYLIVLDDVWKREMLDHIKRYLPDSEKGSRVLITTRSGNFMNLNPYAMTLLNEEESWSLFTKKVFQNVQIPIYNLELEWVGQQIVEQCRGLPLALVLLGGFLSGKEKTPTEWLRWSQLINWSKEENLMEILVLSYNDLPFHLRWCFLYLCFFPEDHEIEAGTLLRLWIAEGFVKKEENVTLELTAEKYLDELCHRCLIQVTSRTTYGSVENCRVQDFVLEFAITEARKLRFFDVKKSEDYESSEVVRRLAIHTDNIGDNIWTCPKNLRTLTVTFISPYKLIQRKNLRLLRVLRLEDLGGINIDKMGGLINLRYLSIDKMGASSDILSSSLCKLRFLQTLDLRTCYAIELPASILSIDTLRHVLGWSLGIIDPGIRTRYEISKELRTVNGVRLSPWIATNLKNFINLTNLGIDEVWVEDIFCQTISAIKKLQHINSIDLECNLEYTKANVNDIFESGHNYLRRLHLTLKERIFIDCNRLPQNLTDVRINGGNVDNSFFRLLGCLHYLKKLWLGVVSFSVMELVCHKGSFPQLQILTFIYLKIRSWVVEEHSMICLKKLKIDSCYYLEMLPEGLQNLNALTELDVRYMPADFKERLRNSVGDDWYKIQHVAHVSIKS